MLWSYLSGPRSPWVCLPQAHREEHVDRWSFVVRPVAASPLCRAPCLLFIRYLPRNSISYAINTGTPVVNTCIIWPRRLLAASYVSSHHSSLLPLRYLLFLVLGRCRDVISFYYRVLLHGTAGAQLMLWCYSYRNTSCRHVYHLAPPILASLSLLLAMLPLSGFSQVFWYNSLNSPPPHTPRLLLVVVAARRHVHRRPSSSVAICILSMASLLCRMAHSS